MKADKVKDLADVKETPKKRVRKEIDMDDVLEMYNAGCSPEEIGEKYGVTRQTIYNRLKAINSVRTGMDPNKKEWSMGRPERLYGGAIQSLEKWCTATNEEISQLMTNVVKWRELGKIAPVKTDEECAERLDAFFDYIIRTGEKPSIEKMALCLGVTTDTITKWKNGVFGSRARQTMINYAIQALAAMDAELVNNNKIPQVTYIFRSKNFFGMRDQTEVFHHSDSRKEIDEEELRKRILQGVIDSAEDGDYVAIDEDGKVVE